MEIYKCAQLWCQTDDVNGSIGTLSVAHHVVEAGLTKSVDPGSDQDDRLAALDCPHLLYRKEERIVQVRLRERRRSKILEDMIAYDLVLREDNQYLSLALLPLDYTEEEFDMSQSRVAGAGTYPQNATLPVV